MDDADRECVVAEMRRAIHDVVRHRIRAKLLFVAGYVDEAEAEGELDRAAWIRVRAAVAKLAAEHKMDGLPMDADRQTHGANRTDERRAIARPSPSPGWLIGWSGGRETKCKNRNG